jgi:hypothetical protein
MDTGNPPFRAPFGARQVHTEDYKLLYTSAAGIYLSIYPAVSTPLQSGKYGIGLQRCVPWPHAPTLAAAWCRYWSPLTFWEAARSSGVPSALACPPTPAA